MILITGGAGYIGSHTVKALLESGQSVVVVDNLFTGHQSTIDELRKIPNANLHFYKGDLRDRQFLDSVFSKHVISSVIHFAALSQVGESNEIPIEYYDNNVGGTISLLSIMQKHKVRKIVFSSTAAAYGNAKEIPIPENAETKPINTYGNTKITMETMMKDLHKADGTQYVALRYFNAAGASLDGTIGELHAGESHLIPRVIFAAMGIKEVKIFGTDYETEDGTCIRDYIDVKDLAQFHINAVKWMDKDAQNIGEFNLGNGNGYSVLEIIEAVKRVTGKEFNAERVARRPGDPDSLVASCAKAIQTLDYRPQFAELDSIIQSAYNFFSKNKERIYALNDIVPQEISTVAPTR